MHRRLGRFYSSCRSWKGGGAVPMLIFSIAVLFSGARLKAQSINAISGTVTDRSGAVIAGAHVVVTNTSTGVATSIVTSTEGTFTISGLIPGVYSVAVDLAGFKRTETNVTVEVAKTSTANLEMVPGSISQTVEVKASVLSLETTSPTVGTTLEPDLVKTAPIEISGLARQIDSFMYLAPGVTGSASSHNINGGVTYENEVQFNGVPVAFVDYAGNQTYINPPYEAVSEFRINSSTFDAQYGLGQGTVAFSMASGTNTLHGDAFEIVRNQFFDSPGFFPVRFGPTGNPLPPIDQENNFGFTLGGPVYLPKVYNGKNRTFFYFSTDWFRQNLAEHALGTVPTPAMKAGDFSQFVDSSGNQIPIYDPQTGQPFPGNIIPPARISPLSNSLLSLIPDPDRPGINSGLQSNKSPAVPSVAIRQHLWSYTIDHNLSPSQSIHFSQWQDSVSSPYFAFAPIVPASSPLQSEVADSNAGSTYLLNYTKSITPTLMVTAGANYVRANNFLDDANKNVSFPAVAGGTTFPFVNFDGQNAPTPWGVPGDEYLSIGSGGLTTHHNRKLGLVAVNNWMWTRGRNSFNFGGQFRHTYQDIQDCAFCGGLFYFSQRTTSLPNSNAPDFGMVGSSFASFLLGQVDATARMYTPQLYMRSKAFTLYAQDDIKWNSRLTVNVGLRWDVLVPFTEDHNNIVYSDPNVPDPGAGNIPGGITQFGHCQLCSGFTRGDIHWRYAQPRLGFAYKANAKTVIRSGFYFTMLDGGAYEYGTEEVAAYYSSLLTGEFVRVPTGTDIPSYGSWDGTSLPIPQPVPLSPSMGNGGVTMTFPHAEVGKAPYDSAWSFGVQRELPWNMFLTVSYVGNRAIHLPTTLSLPDQPYPSVLKYGACLGQPITDPCAAANGIQAPYPEFVQQLGTSATVEQALAPFPQYTGLYPAYESNGTALYNAVQVQAEKRFSNSLSYLADLTVGRLMANTSVGSAPQSPNGINAFNTRPEYSPSQLDQLYNMHFVLSYEPPIGTGRRYLNSKGPLGKLLGGWTLSGIFTYSGGFPFGAFNPYNPLLVNFNDRPDIDPSVKLQTYSYNLSKDYFLGKETTTQPLQFTTNAFVNTGPWQVGDAKRTYAALRTPPLRQENLAIVKAFPITERVKCSLRFECFNCFDRVQLQPPDNNSLDSTFGQIINLTSQIINRQGQASLRLEF